MPKVKRDYQANPGGGRKTLRSKQLREQGRVEEAAAIAPPSERPRTLDPANLCGSRTTTPPHNPCTRLKGAGTDHQGYGHCSNHGGNTKAGLVAAMREMARDLVAKQKAADWRFGGNRMDPSIASLTPEQIILEEVRRSAAMCRFLEERIARWNINSTQLDLLERFVKTPSKYTRGSHNRKDWHVDLQDLLDEFLGDLPPEDDPWMLPPLMSIHDRTGISSYTDLREWLTVYREERAHLARVAKMTIDAGVASRLVSLAEDQGRILATAIRAVLDALDLTLDQRARVPQIVPPILRAVAANQPLPSLDSLLGTGDSEPRALAAGPR